MVSKRYLFCLKVSFFVKKVNWTMIFMQLAKNNPTYWWIYYYYTRLFISILLVVGCGGGDNYMSNVFGIGFLFPPADFVLFCIWYLIFICLVSKRYLFSIFFVSIWYLIDTQWTLDTQLHPCSYQERLEIRVSHLTKLWAEEGTPHQILKKRRFVVMISRRFQVF